MFSIILRTLKDRKVSIAVYTIAAVAFLWMYVALFPTIQGQAEQLQGLSEALPVELLDSMGVDAESFGFETLESFLALENFSFIWPIMALFMIIGYAGWAIASDIDKGTIEHILAKPVSRTQIFFGRYLAGIAMLIVFTFLSIYAVIPFAELHGVEYAISSYWPIFGLSFLFGWAIFGIAMMASAFFSEKSKVSMSVGGLILLMYVANIVSALVDKLENVQYLSFFYYYDHTAALMDHVVSWEAVAVFSGVAIITTLVGVFWFNKRDIAT